MQKSPKPVTKLAIYIIAMGLSVLVIAWIGNVFLHKVIFQER